MKKFILIAAASVALIVIPPAQASASCGGGVSYNQAGEPARFTQAQPRQGMNCASVRYVVDKWLRTAYARSWSARIPTRFFDGYVTWSCRKTSSLRWRCEEYTSNTAFRFKAYTF